MGRVSQHNGIVVRHAARTRSFVPLVTAAFAVLSARTTEASANSVNECLNGIVCAWRWGFHPEAGDCDGTCTPARSFTQSATDFAEMIRH